MDQEIRKSNKIPGCEQLTRPEEIAALSKYLKEIKEVQEEHTELGEDSLEVPGRTTGKIPKIDSLEDLILGPEKEVSDKIDLPNSILHVSEPLKKIEKLETTIESPEKKGVEINKLEDVIIKAEDGKDIPLDSTLIELENNTREPRLEDKFLSLQDRREPVLETEIKDLGSDLEDSKLEDKSVKLGGEQKESELVKSTVGLVGEQKITSLSELTERFIGEVEEQELSEYKEEIEIDQSSDLVDKTVTLEADEDNELSDKKERLNEEGMKEIDELPSTYSEFLRQVIQEANLKLSETELYRLTIKLLQNENSEWADKTASLVSTFLSGTTIDKERAKEFEDLLARSYIFPRSITLETDKNNNKVKNILDSTDEGFEKEGYEELNEYQGQRKEKVLDDLNTSPIKKILTNSTSEKEGYENLSNYQGQRKVLEDDLNAGNDEYSSARKVKRDSLKNTLDSEIHKFEDGKGDTTLNDKVVEKPEDSLDAGKDTTERKTRREDLNKKLEEEKYTKDDSGDTTINNEVIQTPEDDLNAGYDYSADPRRVRGKNLRKTKRSDLSKLKAGDEIPRREYQIPEYNWESHQWLDSGIKNLLTGGSGDLLRKTAEEIVGNTRGSLRTKLLNETLALLVRTRYEAERAATINKDRLPGYSATWMNYTAGAIKDGINAVDSIMSSSKSGEGITGSLIDIGKNAVNKTIANVTAGFGTGIPTEPFNRPKLRYGPSNIVTDVIRSIKETKVGNFRKTETTKYGPHNEYDIKSKKENYQIDVTGRVLELQEEKFPDHLPLSEAISIAVAEAGGVDRVRTLYASPYDSDALNKITLKELCTKDSKTDPEWTSIEDLYQILENSDYITTSGKINRGCCRTLDFNTYWEIKMQPFIDDNINSPTYNGGFTFLPGYEEINIINRNDYNIETNYNSWVPVVGFELQKSKITTKSIGLFDGEIVYPVGMEFTNELRLTIIDDMWKSWKHYFQKCANVAIYNSEPRFIDDFAITSPLAVDKEHQVVSFYKNITFQIEIYIMTPQYATVRKFNLLCVLKDYSEEYSGEVEGGGGSDITLSFSIVGEKSNYADNPLVPDYVGIDTTIEPYRTEAELIRFDDYARDLGSGVTDPNSGVVEESEVSTVEEVSEEIDRAASIETMKNAEKLKAEAMPEKETGFIGASKEAWNSLNGLL